MNFFNAEQARELANDHNRFLFLIAKKIKKKALEGYRCYAINDTLPDYPNVVSVYEELEDLGYEVEFKHFDTLDVNEIIVKW